MVISRTENSEHTPATYSVTVESIWNSPFPKRKDGSNTFPPGRSLKKFSPSSNRLARAPLTIGWSRRIGRESSQVTAQDFCAARSIRQLRKNSGNFHDIGGLLLDSSRCARLT